MAKPLLDRLKEVHQEAAASLIMLVAAVVALMLEDHPVAFAVIPALEFGFLLLYFLSNFLPFFRNHDVRNPDASQYDHKLHVLHSILTAVLFLIAMYHGYTCAYTRTSCQYELRTFVTTFSLRLLALDRFIAFLKALSK